MAKGHGNGETTTNTNSHINVAGTTYQNVGGDYILDGAVEKGGYMTGHIGGGIKATSRQDTANYEGKQTNAGFNVDVDLVKHGTGTSISLNGGRTKADADYAAVIEQTGLQYQKSDVVVDGKSTFKGAYFTTATPEDNKTQFKGGLEVSDIQNHSEYKASGYSGGISLSGNPSSTVKDVLGSTKSTGIGYGKDGDSQTSMTYGAVTGMAGKSLATANVGSLNEVLQNNFDKDRVNAEIDSQVQVSQAFDTERQAYRGEMAKKEQDLRDAAKEAEKQGDKKKADELNAKADKQQHDMVILDGITGAIFGPNTNGVTGYVAKAIAPEISYQIGQYFKGNDYVNGKLDTNLPGEGSAPHILAHGILAAAVSYATGNNVTTGALSAMGAEAGAKYVAQYLYGVGKPSDLTAEQKQTVSNITSLAGIGLGATTGDVGSVVNAGEAGKVAVDNNSLFINNKGLVLLNTDDGNLNIYQLSCKDLLCDTPGKVVGRTMFADSFTSPDTGKPVGIIYLGQSIDSYLYNLNDKARREISAMVGYKSRAGGEYDIKQHYPGHEGSSYHGFLFEGQYISLRDAGNILAGMNAAVKGQSFDDFQKASGALQQNGILGVVLNRTFGTTYGNSPTYGENNYQYYKSKYGYQLGIQRIENNLKLK